MGRVQGVAISEADGSVSFMGLTLTEIFDPAPGIEFRDWLISCPNLPPPPPEGTIIGQRTVAIAGEKCSIIQKLGAEPAH